ncbi:MAG: hypothetical protein LBV43_13460 [Prevotella sp.]|jgi:hypothetical protein|nr:hypothetical protein [Prevotella sp.]
MNKQLPLLSLAILLLFSCKQKSIDIHEDDILCKITSHTENATVENGKETFISANIDSQNNTIKNVSFYFNGVLIDSVKNAPYELRDTISNFLPGKSVISVVATSASGKEYKDEINVNFKINLRDRYQGGRVFKLSEDGKHGLIVSEEDMEGGTLFGKFLYDGSNKRITAATNMGDGKANTQSFVKQYSSSETAYAAIACNNYRGGGYKDWYLPSHDELAILANFSDLMGELSFDNYRFWSSTEAMLEIDSAYALDLETSEMILIKKVYLLRARAIRQF